MTSQPYSSPHFVLDLAKVRANYQSLQAALPEVDIHYAVKANPHQKILSTLQEAGCGFDVCSPNELEEVLGLGCPVENLVYSHPVKTKAAIEAALKAGIRVFVADNATEVEKFRGLDNSETLLELRLSFKKPSSKQDFSSKFGIGEPWAILDLARKAAEIGFQNFGLTYHIGSPTTDPLAFQKVLKTSKSICEELMQEGFEVGCVNMGGGLPPLGLLPEGGIEAYVEFFRAEIAALREMGMAVKMEPGRYMVTDCMELHCSVIGKALRRNRPWYYIDANIYNALAGKWADAGTYQVSVPGQEGPMQLRPSVITGNTCDPIDVVEEAVWLPDLAVGDPLIFHGLGAYSTAMASAFNGFPIPPIHIRDEQEN